MIWRCLRKAVSTISQDRIDALMAATLAPGGVAAHDAPMAIIVVGAIGAGKTYHRHHLLKDGFVQIDSADIFHALSDGDPTLDFPDAFDEAIERIGSTVAHEAIARRLHIAIETPGHEQPQLLALIEALKHAGYVPELRAITADRETCERQNESRGDNVSSCYAAPIHVAWVIEACGRADLIASTTRTPTPAGDSSTADQQLANAMTASAKRPKGLMGKLRALLAGRDAG